MGDEDQEMPAGAADAAETGEAGANSGPEDAAHARSTARPDRTGLLIAGAVLAACGGLVLYGVFGTADKPSKPPVPTAAVTYEVSGEGTADIAYQGRSEAGTAIVDRAVTLPWTKTVRVPLGKAPLVSITLGDKGGQASCSLAVRGKHVQTASAFGRFGRATCQSELASPTPAPERTEAAG
ncbi:hypothetical protein [Streptomyces sp. NPDC046805]|uniref:hypothetical protein n=1 Tax=Streptomyces sp. NPDC046805 TaxID=3155134 RepID=UPI0033E84757